MTRIADQHRALGPPSVRIAVVTVSDTRTRETDTSGSLLVDLAEAAGHIVIERTIVLDEPARIIFILEAYRGRDDLHAIILTGGTGISPRDGTFEIVSGLLTKPLPGFGELFRMLSYAEIGPACIMSRAVGGLMGELVVLSLPGSRAAVELAMTRIILPELAHLVQQARKR